ncbi:hypothetical protein [Candidatus Leptofilum sp.]
MMKSINRLSFGRSRQGNSLLLFCPPRPFCHTKNGRQTATYQLNQPGN